MMIEMPDSIDRIEFARIINRLLLENVVYQKVYSKRTSNLNLDEDYVFIREYEECIEAYLRMAGWDLIQENREYISMYYIENRFQQNSHKLGKVEARVLFLLRYFYEEERKNINTTLETSVRKSKLIEVGRDVLGLFQSSMTANTIDPALRAMERLHVIRILNDEDPVLQILPYITVILHNDFYRDLLKELKERKERGELQDEVESSITD